MGHRNNELSEQRVVGPLECRNNGLPENREDPRPIKCTSLTARNVQPRWRQRGQYSPNWIMYLLISDVWIPYNDISVYNWPVNVHTSMCFVYMVSGPRTTCWSPSCINTEDHSMGSRPYSDRLISLRLRRTHNWNSSAIADNIMAEEFCIGSVGRLGEPWRQRNNRIH